MAMTPDEIVAKIAAMRCIQPSEVDGTHSCFFCGAYDPEHARGDKHEPDCVWANAVAAKLPVDLPPPAEWLPSMKGAVR